MRCGSASIRCFFCRRPLASGEVCEDCVIRWTDPTEVDPPILESEESRLDLLDSTKGNLSNLFNSSKSF